LNIENKIELERKWSVGKKNDVEHRKISNQTI